MSTAYGESVIIFGFPGVGKTYAFEHAEELGYTIMDSDSSKFHWVYEDDDCTIPILDENGKKIVHPAWPQNYIQYITLMGRETEKYPDYILCSTHEEVMNALLPLDFTCFTIVPDISMKEDFLAIYKERGSSDEFIANMDKNWDEFVKGTIERSFSSELCNCTVVMIRKEGKIQNVSDLLKLHIVNPMEFEE